MKSIDQSIYASAQTLYGTEVAKVGGAMVRARIERNAYDFQSLAVAEAWVEGQGWKNLISYDITTLEVAKFSYSTAERTPWPTAMARDLRELLKRAEAITTEMEA